DLGDRELAKFLDQMERLNSRVPDVMPRASQHISEIQRLAQRLLDEGVAYEIDGNVYFQVAQDSTFGKLVRAPYAVELSRANQGGNDPGDPKKQDPLDFVLWQRSKPGEPSWESPWGSGRPGWHIECSAMSMKYLGETFTIHG